jgi:hypothetical protein
MNLYIFLCVSAISVNVIAQGESNLINEFNIKYKAWKEYVSHPAIMAKSTGSARINNKFFSAIVDLGPNVLPIIVEKMQKDSEADILWQAIQRIAKVKLEAVYDKTSNKMIYPEYSNACQNVYICWWESGRFQTKSKFVILYNKWKVLKSENKDKEARVELTRIINLGIPVLPYLIDSVQIHPELMAAISFLSNNEISFNADVATLMQWWENNKQKYLILMDTSDFNKVHKK